MEKYILTCKEPNIGISELADSFVKEMSNDAQLIVKDYTQMGATGVVLIVFEKYFFRNNAYTTLTTLLTHYEGIQTAKIVASGGGESLINVSLGAHKSIANDAISILSKFNFK